MHTEDLASYNGSNWQGVKGVDECFPNFDVASAFAFIVKTIDPRDVRAFMVASQDEEVLGIFKFVTQKQQYRLQALLAAIHIVPQEQEVACWWKAAHFEETD